MRNSKLLVLVALTMAARVGLSDEVKAQTGGLSIPPEALASPYGIEYVLPGLNMHSTPATAAKYKDIGAHWVKFQDCPWRDWEPQPPTDGKHTYTWEKFDNYVRWWQEYGYQIQVHLKTISPWAVQPPKGFFADNKDLMKKMAPFVSTPPKDEYWDDWGALIHAVVERYDGDGVDDVPGLKYPILYYEMESEAQHTYWMGTIEEYGRILQITYEEAKKACPDVKIILAGLNFGERAKDNPSEEEARRRVEEAAQAKPEVADYLRHIYEFIDKSLAMGKYYDIIEWHALGDYTEVPGTTAFIRRKLADLGFNKEIWVGDANSAPEVGTLAAWFSKETYEGESGNINQILKTPTHKKYAEVRKWYRREQASHTVKMLTVAIDSGCKRTFVGMLEDWWWAPQPHHGLTENDGTPRPVFRAIQFMTGNLDDWQKEGRIQGEKGLYAFKFQFPDRDVYVVWYELNENSLDLPEAEYPSLKYAMKVDNAKTQSAQILTLDDVCADPKATGKQQTIEEGTIRLDLDRYPIFVVTAK